MRNAERSKYERMWAVADYRHWSPGLESVGDATACLGTSGTLIDFGCGDCQALDKLRAVGFDAIGVDIFPTRSDVREVCLWDLPAELPQADFGFCADVMEHIPPAYVEQVFQGISAHVSKAVYFRISTIPDVMGAKIGEKLHLTVKPADWWFAQVCKVFPSVYCSRQTDDHCVIVGSHQ